MKRITACLTIALALLIGCCSVSAAPKKKASRKATTTATKSSSSSALNFTLLNKFVNTANPTKADIDKVITQYTIMCRLVNENPGYFRTLSQRQSEVVTLVFDNFSQIGYMYLTDPDELLYDPTCPLTQAQLERVAKAYRTCEGKL